MGKTYNPLDLREVFKMKKGVLAAFMAAMLAFSLTACGGTGTSESTDKASSDSSSDKVVTLKFAHTVQSGTKTAECIEKLKIIRTLSLVMMMRSVIRFTMVQQCLIMLIRLKWKIIMLITVFW